MILEHIFSYQAKLEKPIPIGNAPFGRRDVFPILGGRVWGEKLQGELLPFGGEFQLTDASGIFRIDVRTIIKTNDDAQIFLHYTGVANFTGETGKQVAKRGQSEFGEAYFVSRPQFETDHEKYNWLNDTVCVAEGRAASLNTVEYKVYACRPSAD